ncbi:hypothetical protein LSAT2_011462, partial [Lamellibrachia satsuma]
KHNMGKLGTYTKRLFILYAAISVICIATLLLVSYVLLRTRSSPVINHRASGMKKTYINGVMTSLSTRRRPYTMGEHYFLAPELDQYYHYTKLNTVTTEFDESNKVRNVDVTRYRHKVSLLNMNIRSAGLFLQVVEQHKHQATSGGSCLYGVSESANYRSVCSFRDFYNGTYIVYCPPAPVKTTESRCWKVTVQLQCVNFTAYSSLYQSLHKTIWRRRVCDNDTNKGIVLGNWPLMRAMKKDASSKNVVTWHLIHKRKWEARMNYGKWFRSLNRSTLCACVKSFGNIYMYGSSHMRFKFDYLLDECYKRPTDLAKKHGKACVGNLHYTWYRFSDQFGRILSDRKDTFKKKDLVFLQTGAHDTSSRGLAVAMSTGIRQFIESLSAFAEVSHRKGFKLVVLTSPPFRDIDNKTNTMGGRNNFALAAFNEMIRVKAAYMGVEVFDEFSILLPRQDENTCNSHYICYNGKLQKITGTVGVTTMQMTMANVCNLM